MPASTTSKLGIGNLPLRVVHALRESIWVLPAALALLSFVLSRLTVAADSKSFDGWVFESLVYSGDRESGRAILSILVSSTITVTGMVFSVTVVALTFASSQLGPRLLTVFRRDRLNQLALGSFLGTYVFSLSVLSCADWHGPVADTPHISISVGLLLATASFIVLILFIHRLANTLQADRMTTHVRGELSAALHTAYPLSTDRPPEDLEKPELEKIDIECCVEVASNESGYVEAIDKARLARLSAKENLGIVVLNHPGAHVLTGTPVARVDREPTPEIRDAVNEAILIGSTRTELQDVEFAMRQLVEIGLRALSPGINDPFTALAVIDNLGSALASLHERHTPSWARASDRGRVIVRSVPFEDLMDCAWNQLRQHGASQPAVAIRLLSTFCGLARLATDPLRRLSVRQHAEAVFAQLESAAPQARDLEDARKVFESMQVHVA